MSTGDFPESLSQAILVGMMLVGRLGTDGGIGEQGAGSEGEERL